MSPNHLKPLFYSNWTLILEYELEKCKQHLLHNSPASSNTLYIDICIYKYNHFYEVQAGTLKMAKINVNCCTADNRLFIIPLQRMRTPDMFCDRSCWTDVRPDSGLSQITVGDAAHESLIIQMYSVDVSHVTANEQMSTCSDDRSYKPFGMLRELPSLSL